MKEDVIIHGDVYAGLEHLEDNSVAVAITSPPYWKQRIYGFKGEVGQENTPEEYIGKLVAIFRKLREKLRGNGVFFLNIGDKYLQKYGKSHLLQIPYRLAYHMVRDGWILVDILIWYKPNHMPSPVKDRFANTYEPVFVFAKSKNNIYKKEVKNKVLKVKLEQTKWKHTAVFPENLVLELLNRVSLKDGDIVLDPFAGTGTVGAVVRKLKFGVIRKKLYTVLIDKGSEFIEIMRERTRIKNVIKVDDIPYRWEPVKERSIKDLDIDPKIINTSKYGEVFIAENPNAFLAVLRGITKERFKRFHREDALFFFGVEKWNLECLYYPHSILDEGYVLRNMIVVNKNGDWYPIFMFAKDTKRIQYRFFLDRIRVKPKYEYKKDWGTYNFEGMKVIDSIRYKDTRYGIIIKVLKSYSDGFPMVVLVRWRDSSVTIEFVLHPDHEEDIRYGIRYKCPFCGSYVEEFDPLGDNFCNICKKKLWVSLDSFPIIEEPKIVKEIIDNLKNLEINISVSMSIESFEKKRKKKTNSKFFDLDRINWGASPGARLTVMGEYFTVTRLYEIPQYIVAQYLNLLRKRKGLTISDLEKYFPVGYKHTIGHWFRKDFGGSIPRPIDIPLLKRIFADIDARNLLSIIERVALKLQTVKTSKKGKNPGDYFENVDKDHIIYLLKRLFLPNT